MKETWFIGDTHFSHVGMVNFTDNDGKKIRPFATIEEHDETLISNINALVKPNDRLYFLGDVVINRKALPILNRINGKKKLIKGNHDIFKLHDYTPYFEDIAAYRIYPKDGIIMSHIPIHPQQLEYRFKWNVHGHMHSNKIMGGYPKDENDKREYHPKKPDPKYLNICPEHTDFNPVNYEQILKMLT